MSKILWMVVVSPEVLVALACVNVVIRCPNVGREVGILILEKDLIRDFLLVAPIGALLLAYNNARYLLNPPEAKQSNLYKWADYRFLRYRAYYTFVVCTAGIVASALILLLRKGVSLSVVGSLYGTVTCTWFISVITLAIARLRVSAILGGEP